MIAVRRSSPVVSRTSGLMWTSAHYFRPLMRRRSKPSTQTYVCVIRVCVIRVIRV